jgi:WS/DGAT/MGAT family acyltransferase
VAGLQIAALVVDGDASKPALTPLDPLPPEVDTRRAGDLLAASVADNAEQAARWATRAARHALPATVTALRHPRSSACDVWATGASLARMVTPATDTLSPVLTERGMGRRFETVEQAMIDVRRAAAMLDCTVNDVFLAAVTGGLRRYHERHGATVGELRMGLPLSLRRRGEFGGNRVTLVRFPVPVGDPDPARRIEATRRAVRQWRNAPAHRMTEEIAFALNLAPRAALGTTFKHVDFLASNVPGFDIPVYLAGSRVLAYYPFGPAFGSAVNATLMSYAGACYIGLDADTAALPDTEVFARCLHAGFGEVFAAGAPRVRIPAQRRAGRNRQGSAS